ncbi:hypothetical protein QCA50_011302 [Cerrena zonata]|uniref:Uncharacterized protein n=1 Tax=Cerrena zonata TaxID=2478898 RepID=A0AAW0G171_9APHY
MEPLAVPEIITFHSVARTDIPGVPTHGLNKVVDDSATPLQNLEGTGITLCFLMAGYPGDLPTVRIANVQKLTRQELFDRASAILSRWCLLAKNGSCGLQSLPLWLPEPPNRISVSPLSNLHLSNRTYLRALSCLLLAKCRSLTSAKTHPSNLLTIS